MGDSSCKSEANTRECFLCVSDFQPSGIVSRLEPRSETIPKSPLYLVRREPRNGLAHALRARESEQRAFLSGACQNAFIHVQGDVTQKRGLLCVQRDVSNRVLYEEGSERDEEVLLFGGEVERDLDGDCG